LVKTWLAARPRPCASEFANIFKPNTIVVIAYILSSGITLTLQQNFQLQYPRTTFL
jgi:hypothetical protein